MLKWILWATMPILVGAIVAAALLPKNRGKKEPTEIFTVQYPNRIKITLIAVLLGMCAVMAANAMTDKAVFDELALFYLVYLVLAGLLIAMLLVFMLRQVQFNKGVVTVTSLRKATTFTVSEIKHMDIGKNDVKLYSCPDGKNEKLLCSMGIMMENLDYFFAWAHTRKGIRMTLEGKELKKKK